MNHNGQTSTAPHSAPMAMNGDRAAPAPGDINEGLATALRGGGMIPQELLPATVMGL